MKDWDFFGLLQKGNQEENQRQLMEDLQQYTISNNPQNAPQSPPQAQTSPEVPNQGNTDLTFPDVPDVTDVTDVTQAQPEVQQVTEDQTFLEATGQALGDIATQSFGGALDTLDNTIDFFANYDIVSSPKVVFNIPGLPNYDSRHPSVFTMDDKEFDALYEKGKITYLPKIPETNTITGQFTRGMAQALSGIYMGSKTLKLVKAGVTATGSSIATTGALSTEKLTGKAIKMFGPGVVGSLFSYKPYTPRLSNSIDEFIANTPFDVAQPFFQWVGSSDDNSEAEERFKAALETYLTDISTFGASKAVSNVFKTNVFKMFKRERALMQGEMKNTRASDLDEIDAELVSDIKNTKVETPVEEVVQAETQGASRVGKVKDGVVDVTPETTTADDLLSTYGKSTDDDVFDQIARESTGASFKYSSPEQPSIFNTSKVEELGARKVLNIIGARLEDTFRKRQPGTPFGPKKLEEIKIDGLNTYDASQVLAAKANISDLADDLGVDKDFLFQAMKKDLNDVVGLEARILSYRVLLSEQSSEFDQLVKAAVNDPTDVTKAARAYNKWQDIQDTLGVFSELRRTVARTTTAQRISIPKRDTLSPEDLQKIAGDLKDKNVDDKLMLVLNEASQLSANPLKRVKNIRELQRTYAQKGWDAVVELYRGMILASGKTHVTNVLSGGFESIFTPMSTAIGSAFRGDKKSLKDASTLVTGLFTNVIPSAKWALRAITDERNFLDPAGTKLDSSVKSRGHAIAMNLIDPNKSVFSPVNWMTLGVNTTGKIARGSLRLLGGEDEFFKQLNYRAKVYQKIISDMPDSVKTRAQRKAYVDSKMDQYFDPNTGVALDKDALNYAQRITFTEDLQNGSAARALQEAANEKPWLKLVFPFVKTPSNIFTRYLERTPFVSPFLKTTRERWATGDPQIRSEIIGNMALGTMMYGSAVTFVGTGKITGGGPTDPDQKKIWLAAGNQPYSIKVGDSWVSYNRFDPTAMPFALVADIYENAWKYSDQEVDSMIGGALAGFMQGVTNRTWLQSFKRFVDIYDVAAKGQIDTSGGKLAGQFVSGFIPPIINETYGLFEGPQPFYETRAFIEKIEAKAAPLTGYKAVKHNWLTGEPLIHPFMYNTGIPVSTEKVNPTIEELAKMSDFIVPPSFKFGNVPLSGQEYADYCKTIGTIQVNGKNLLQTLEDFMQSPDFESYPGKVYRADYQDSNVFLTLKIISKFKEAARLKMLSENTQLRTRVENDMENKINSLNNSATRLFDLNP